MKHEFSMTLCMKYLFVLLCVSSWANAEHIFINNANLYTGSGIYKGMDVIVDGNRIVEVDKSLGVPVGARVIDATGKALTAGLFNAATHIGVTEINAIESTVDIFSTHTTLTAAIKIADAFNPESLLIPHNRIQGLTRALVLPESRVGLFAGQAAIVELGETPSVINDSVAMVVQLGEAGKEISGGSRAVALAMLRLALDEAKDLQTNALAVERGERYAYSHSLQDLRALIPVIRGEQLLMVKVDRAADIHKMLNLATEYALDIVLVGAQEAWKLAERIAAANVPVIMDPIENLPSSYETLGARLDSASILHDAGVTLIFTGMSWHNTHNAYSVRQSAGNAVANGLPMAAAIAAMTINPARIFHMPNYGDIAPGQVADLVLWDMDPLEVMSYPTAVLIDGVTIENTSRQLELRDRYFQRLQAK